MVAVQCRHTLKMNGQRFVESEWDERHLRRKVVFGGAKRVSVVLSAEGARSVAGTAVVDGATVSVAAAGLDDGENNGDEMEASPPTPTPIAS